MSNLTEEQLEFAFGKQNYLFMIVGVVLIVLGLVFLSGGGSQDPNVFNEAIFNTQRMIVAPMIMLSGFVLEIYAIMYRPKSKE